MEKKNDSTNAINSFERPFSGCSTHVTFTFFMPYPPPTSPCDPMLSECWRKAIRRTTRKLSELVDFLGSLLTTWNTGGTEQAFPRTAHMVVCTSPRIRRKRPPSAMRMTANTVTATVAIAFGAGDQTSIYAALNTRSSNG